MKLRESYKSKGHGRMAIGAAVAIVSTVLLAEFLTERYNQMWRVGDKAYKVVESAGSDWFDFPNGQPEKGGTYLVVGTGEDDLGNATLRIAGYPSISTVNGKDYGYLASSFRKVVPASERAEKEESHSL